MQQKQLFRRSALVAVLVGLLAASWLLPLGPWVESFAGWIEGRGATGVALFAGGYVLGTLLFVPGALLTIAAGVVYGVGWGTLLALTSASVGATLAFLVARYLARAPVERWAARHETFRALDAAIGARAWKVVALLRLSPLLPFNLSNYLFGVTKARLGPYVLASFVGMAPGTLLYVYLGHAGVATLGERDSPPSKPEIVFLAAGLVATAAVSWYLARLAREELKKS